MEENKKSKLFEEGLRRFKYRVDYKINETPKYRPLIGDGEIFDEVPLMEVGDEEDTPKPEGTVPTEPSNDQPVGMETPVSDYEKEEMKNDMPPTGGDMPLPMGGEAIQPNVDEIQNEIIKHNIEAMKSIHDQLENLNQMTQSLNTKLDELNADVEEVREPTNAEKLMSKKNVSYPYYFNLNDFWSGNWFSEKRENEMEKGIRELPDGTFIADFDDLPQQSKIDVQNSFNEIYESKKKSRLIENVVDKSAIDGVASKRTAINYLYKILSPLTKGFFSDNSWENVHKIFKTFDKMNLDWNMIKAEYDGSMPPKRKTWYFEIDFMDNIEKPKKIYGNITAAGAGSVEDPLEKYDLSLILS